MMKVARDIPFGLAAGTALSVLMVAALLTEFVEALGSEPDIEVRVHDWYPS